MIMVTVNLGMHEKDHGHDLLVTHHRLHVPQEETEAQGVKQVTWAAQLYNADSPSTRAASVLLPGSTPPLRCLEDLASHPQRRYSRDIRGQSRDPCQPRARLFTSPPQAVDTIFQAGPGMARGNWVIAPNAASEE